MSKLRVLCLHGFTSNGSVHAHQVRNITKALSDDFEFLFPDGPHVVDMSTQPSSPTSKAWSEYVTANSTTGHRAWWFVRSSSPIPGERRGGRLEGLEKSLDFISDLIERTGPVHAIWGFSQGGCFAGILMSLLSEKQKGQALRARLSKKQQMPQAGVFFSGFRAKFSRYDDIYAGIDVPTLHIVGEKDDIVSIEKASTLWKVCRDPIVLQHAGGHDIPASEIDQSKVVAFLKENVRNRSREAL